MQIGRAFVWEESMMFHQHVGIKVLNVADGHAEAIHEITEESRNPFGTVHGGMLGAIADHVTGYAACSTGRLFVTQSSNLQFIANQAEGVIKAYADVIHAGKHTAIVDIKILGEDEKLLLTGTYTMYCVGEMDPKILETIVETL